MAISFLLAIISVVIVVLVIVPAIAVYLFSKGVTVRRSVLLEPLYKTYQICLRWAMDSRKTVISLAGILVVIAGILLPQLGTEFVPELEEGTINLRVTLAPSASLDTALMVAPKLEAILLAFPEVEYALSRIGRPEVGGDPEPFSKIEIYLGLKPVSEWQSAANRAQLQVVMEQ